MIERTTNEYSKRISNVTTLAHPLPSRKVGGKEAMPPPMGGPTASASNICHSLPMDRITWFDKLRKKKDVGNPYVLSFCFYII